MKKRLSAVIVSTALLVILAGCQLSTSQVTVDENGAASVLRSASSDGAIPVRVSGNPTGEQPDVVNSSTITGLNRGGSRDGLVYGLKPYGVATAGTFVLVYYDPPVAIDYDEACRAKTALTSGGKSEQMSAAVILCGTPLIRRFACEGTGLCTADKAMRAVYFQLTRPASLNDRDLQSQLAAAANDLASDQNNKDPKN